MIGKWWVGLLSLLLGLTSVALAQTSEVPLRLAVHPYASTLALINTHRPLVQYLSQNLGRTVEFYTAPSFDGFTSSLFDGDYDIAIAPPHFAVIAQDRKRYTIIVRYRAALEPLLIVRSDSGYRSISDLKGKRIAMADRTAMIRLVTLKWLAENGMRPDDNFQIVERPNHGAAVGAALAGEADAGLATEAALRQLPPNVQQLVRTIPTGQRYPNLFTLASRSLPEALVNRLRAVLLAFQNTPEGRQFMEQSGYLGYESVTEGDLRHVRPYADMYQRLSGGAAR